MLGHELVAWHRWCGWQAGDPRWRVRTVDTSHRAPEQVVAELAGWIDEERALLRAGDHPLAAVTTVA